MSPVRNKIILAQGLALFLVLMSSSAEPFQPSTAQRRRINFNTTWKFYKGDPGSIPYVEQYNDNSWETVSIPHTLEVTTADNPELYRGIGWYRKRFTLDADKTTHKIFIEFQGVMQVTEVWVNNTKVGKYEVSGYDSFHFDITDYVNGPGEDNLIAVKCDNSENSNCPPDGERMDFMLFGGIYRDVFLVITDKMYINFPWEAREAGIYITTPDISSTSAKVNIRTTVKNEYVAAKSCELRTIIVDAGNEVVDSVVSTQSIPAGSVHTFSQETDPVSNPRLWSPDSPYLYTAYSRVVIDNTPVDLQSTRFGMRWFEVKPNSGFFLNGEHLKLFGANRHQTYPFVGNAVPNNMQRWDAGQMKRIGMQWVRASHYPYDPDFLDYCDELGMLVLEEGPTWMDEGNATWMSNLEKSFRSMIRRDRNHPSIFIWNTCVNHHGCKNILRDAAGEEDPTRLRGQCDVPCPMCFNHPFTESNGAFCIEHTGHMFPTARYSEESRLVEHAQKHWEMLNTSYGTPGNSGMAAWCMYDYNTYHNHWEGKACHGLCDLFRIPKHAFYWYQAELTEEPMVYIAGYWRQSSPSPVTIFSNCEEVEVFVNGVSKGKSGPDRGSGKAGLTSPPFIFNIPYEAGELKAVGYIGDAPRAEHIRRTPGAAAAVHIAADFDTLDANGADLTRLVVSVVDQNGTVVPDATNTITFEKASGIGTLIGENPIDAVAGKIIALVQSPMEPGTGTFAASSPGLNEATATIAFSKGRAGLPAKNPMPQFEAIFDKPTNAFFYEKPGHLRLQLGKRQHVSVAVITTSGRIIKKVARGTFNAGAHVIPVSPGKMPNGSYFWQMIVDGRIFTEKMVVMR
ncbi:MAG: DUF4982 domain-containing protein [Chitinivibrionales bacterium]|nr:DUF4982 domain-containing protein [Chitinivibrionales bacterium]